MGLALLRRARVFTLHVRCMNCLREKSQRLGVPVGEGAPESVQDLYECGTIEGVSFECDHCGGVCGKLIGISGGELG